MSKINKDLEYLGIKCECMNLYEYVQNNSRYDLKFIQNEMPAKSKSLGEFYKNLEKMDKFDVREGIQKSYK